MINESNKLEDRQITDINNPAAKIKASQLWSSDLGQYIAFVQDEKIVTGSLLQIIHYGTNTSFRDKDVKKGAIRVSVGSEANSDSYLLRGRDEVWVLQDKPEVTVTGIRIGDKKRY
ncbi:hypothetical protein PP301_gp064 [Gordonia phage GMA2]|uniref:Uncharacterized protein n=1 Tax=Gordonia phage GMA2 TaxID=1647283 RepID=A0A0K0N7C6_9CAUD|nr:hypothetical protein PP301_gp064 [Gordonia phage GMA2]AKJ72658.1 hypothetical protein GMA2_120 [Gordonia phage GMA2]